jgi:hypothetical protein
MDKMNKAFEKDPPLDFNETIIRYAIANEDFINNAKRNEMNERNEMDKAFENDSKIKLSKKYENNLKGGTRNKCTKQTTKKYNKRLSPPYPANECKGMKKKGNNGKFWVSTPDKNKVYKWTPMNSIKEKKTKTNKKTTKTRKKKGGYNFISNQQNTSNIEKVHCSLTDQQQNDIQNIFIEYTTKEDKDYIDNLVLKLIFTTYDWDKSKLPKGNITFDYTELKQFLIDNDIYKINTDQVITPTETPRLYDILEAIEQHYPNIYKYYTPLKNDSNKNIYNKCNKLNQLRDQWENTKKEMNTTYKNDYKQHTFKKGLFPNKTRYISFLIDKYCHDIYPLQEGDYIPNEIPEYCH